MVGKIYVIDRDFQDILIYSLAGGEIRDRRFLVGAFDGKIIVVLGLFRGRYAFNVIVSDGIFIVIVGVYVYVWYVGREVLQQVMWMGFYQFILEELVSDYWRNLQRFFSNKLDIKRVNIYLVSFQFVEVMVGVDVFLVFEGYFGIFYKLQEFVFIIIRLVKEMEYSVGIQMRLVMFVVFC